VDVDHHGSNMRRDRVAGGQGQDVDGDGSRSTAGCDEEMELGEIQARTGE